MLTSINEVVEKYSTIKFKGYSTWDEENPIKLPFNHAFINLKGQKFNHLTVLELFPFKSKDNRPLWIVECDCDAHTIFVVSGKSLRNGNTKSCGCAQVSSVVARNLKHGLAYRNNKSRLYGIHCDMIRRCYNQNRHRYERYGGRGITVCDEWMGENGFINFAKWSFNNGYYEQDNKVVPRSELLSIDRIDPNGNYCPDNCRWISLGKQPRNEENAVRIVIAGISVTAGDLAEFFGVTLNFLSVRHTASRWTDNEIVHALITGDHIARSKKSEYKGQLRDEEEFLVLIPNYHDMNPWSDNPTEKAIAKTYLPDDVIKFLEDIKHSTKQ